MQDSFPARLSTAISASGLSRQEIASRAGITNAALSHYLTGRNLPRSDVARRLSAILDSDLLASSPKPPETRAAVGRVSVKQAARLLGVGENRIRVGIRSGIFPFGVEISGKNSARGYYYISPGKLREFVGDREFDEFFRSGGTNESTL